MKKVLEKKRIMLRLLPNAQEEASLCDFPWYQGQADNYWYAWPHIDLEENEQVTSYFTATVIFVSKKKFDLSSISSSLNCLLRIEQARNVNIDEAMSVLVSGQIIQDENFFYKRIEPDGLLIVKLGQPIGSHFYLINKSPKEVRSLFDNSSTSCK